MFVTNSSIWAMHNRPANNDVISVAGVSTKGRISLEWIILFIIWPFVAFIKVLKNFRSDMAKIVTWLFCVYFGFVFIYEDPSLKNFGADSASYAASLIQMHNDRFSFEKLWSTFYNTDDQVIDIYQPLSTWIVSFFTDDPRWLFAFFASVFGFFYVQNLWIVFQRIDKSVRVSLILFLFLLALVLVNPIWNINGVRMWTGGQVFVYGILRYYILHDKKGLAWSMLSVFFHFAYLFPLVVFLAFLILPINLTACLIFFFVSTLIIEINLISVRSYLSYLPDVFQLRMEGYTNEEYAKVLLNARSVKAWHMRFAELVGEWIIYVWILVTYLYRKKWIDQIPDFYKLFAFALFFGGFAKLAGNVPSGTRYMIIDTMLLYSVFVIILSQNFINFKLKTLKFLATPFLAFYVLFRIRIGLDYIGILTFFGNPVSSLFYPQQLPIISFIKDLLQ